MAKTKTENYGGWHDRMTRGDSLKPEDFETIEGLQDKLARLFKGATNPQTRALVYKQARALMDADEHFDKAWGKLGITKRYTKYPGYFQLRFGIKGRPGFFNYRHASQFARDQGWTPGF